ncbi:MAG: hypothetical protein HC783_17095 [Rhodobacteraceae bacterium]|nr:hypothetical protein [Paracoccaceae bacterium]
MIHMLADDSVADVNGTDLMQILLNLIVNALQCSSAPHRVELRGERLDEPVDVAGIVESAGERLINRDNFANQAPLIAMSITDNGPGIPEEQRGVVFKAFHRLDSSRNQQTGGVGINPVTIIDDLPTANTHNSGALKFATDGTLLQPLNLTNLVLTVAKVLGLVALPLLAIAYMRVDPVFTPVVPTASLRPLASFGVIMIAVMWTYEGWYYVAFAPARSRTRPAMCRGPSSTARWR